MQAVSTKDVSQIIQRALSTAGLNQRARLTVGV